MVGFSNNDIFSNVVNTLTSLILNVNTTLWKDREFDAA
jgi:hypothetical protein